MFASPVDQRSPVRIALALTICVALLLTLSVSQLVIIGSGKGAYIYIAEKSQPGQERMDAFFTIGELFHLAGSKIHYTDEQLSNVIHGSKFGPEHEKTLDPRANPYSPQYNSKDRDEIDDFSYYFHKIQEIHCFSRRLQFTDY